MEMRVLPRSPRRLARVRRHRLRQRWCNHLITYLSWATVGKPGALTADPRLVATSLNGVQLQARD
eukprot:5950052-Amphidinium_carterae.1